MTTDEKLELPVKMIVTGWLLVGVALAVRVASEASGERAADPLGDDRAADQKDT